MCETPQRDTAKCPPWSIYKTVCSYSAFCSLGLLVTLFGPSLLDLVYLLQIDIKTFGIVFTADGLGNLIGALLCGALYGLFTPELIFLCATGLMGSFAICLPWIRNFPLFVALTFLQATVMGFVNAGSQAYIVSIWTGTKYLKPVMQAAHMMWSLGSAISPLIVQPFLMPKPKHNNDSYDLVDNGNNDSYHLVDNGNSDSYYLITDDTTLNYKTSSRFLSKLATSQETNSTTFINEQTHVYYAFMIVGCICVLVSLLFCIAFCHEPKRICHTVKTKQRKPEQSEQQQTIKDSARFRYGLVTLLFFVYLFYALVEGVLGSFIATFVVEGLKWETYKGSIITTVMYGSLGVGRLLGIPISVYFTPHQMVYTDMFLTTAAITVMLVSVYTTSILMWFGVSLVGLAMGTTFASVLLWAETYINIDGQASSVFWVGCSVARMCGSPIVATLFQTVSHMWMIYFTLGSSVFNIITFAMSDSMASVYKRQFDRKNKIKNSAAEVEPGQDIQLLET